MADNIKGSRKNNLIPEDDKVVLTYEQLNNLISNAVNTAVNAASANVAAPRQEVNYNGVNINARSMIETDFNRKMIANNQLGIRISHEPTVAYAIPQVYQQYVPSVVVSVNGQTIKIPADGIKRQIPIRYIPIIEMYIDNIDKKVATMQATQSQYGGIAEIKGGAL